MDHTPQNVIHGESVVPPAKKKKISVTFFNTANNKVTKTFLEPDNWIEQLDECSPMCSQEDRPVTRFPWKKPSPPPPINQEEKWTPPTPNTIPYFIFKRVKEYLQYTGPDRLMKTSPEMVELLNSDPPTIIQVTKKGRQLSSNAKRSRQKFNTKESNIENEEVIDVKFTQGRITWRVGGGNEICRNGDCWQKSKSAGNCREHSDNSDNLITQFLMRDNANQIPTYALFWSNSHTSKMVHTESTILKLFKNSPSSYAAAYNYSESRKKAGEKFAEDWTPQWKLVTEKPFIVGHDKSSSFAQTICITLAILSMKNAEEPDPKKKIFFIKDQISIDKVDWTIVMKILTSVGVTMELGEYSDHGKKNESPLLRIEDLKWRHGDSWNYFKFGTIGRVYVGIVTQNGEIRKPMPDSFIHHGRHHSDDKGKDAKGIPIYQCQEGDEEFKRKENKIMEGVGQMAVIVCEMLGGVIDGAPIRIDFDKLENNSDWEERHLERMKTLVGFFSSKKLHLVFPEVLSVESVDWNDVGGRESVLSESDCDDDDLFKF